MFIYVELTPGDNPDNDNATHKQLRAATQELIDTADDKELSVQEVKNVVTSMGGKKVPGEDGTLSEVYKGLMEILPCYLTALYNKCLKTGIFPKRWKKAVTLLIIKPRQEGSDEVSKFRPISLLNTGGKVLEKIMINRINYHVYSRGYMNENQYGFRLQKSTVDAAMAITKFVQQALAAGEVIALVSLDVQDAFDSAWWTGILNELWKYKCPKNLYELTKSYFSQRIASWSTNSIRMEKEISRGCPQGSCSGPGLWNL
jgi:hypothetical protein